MSLKRYFGLDGFDLLIHVAITGMVMVVAGNAVVPGGHNEIPISIVAAASLLLLSWRRTRGLREVPPDTGEARLDRLHELEQRVAELEHQHGRVLELEERLDFTERLLTQQREAVRQLGAPREE